VIEKHVFKTSEGKDLSLTISIGVGTLPMKCTDIQPKNLSEDLVERADQAVYQAKRNGRNQVVLAEAGNLPNTLSSA
jgi:diguanylate cyclase (GGDEF)-like protein